MIIHCYCLDCISSSIFHIQSSTITSINQKVSGNVITLSTLSKIFFNNLKVAVFCIIFSFIYGIGGAALGSFIKSYLAQITNVNAGNYFAAVSMGLMRYSIHGIPEIIAYFLAGLAGGIISIAVIRHDFRSKKFYNIIFDSSDLMLLSILILFIAAILEVYVTPLFF